MEPAHTQEATRALSEQQRSFRIIRDLDGSDDDSGNVSFSENELDEFAKSPMFAMLSEAVERASDELKRELGLRPDGTPINYKVNYKHKSKKRRLSGTAPSSKVAAVEASRSSGDYREETAGLKSRERADKPDGKPNGEMDYKQDKLEEEISRRRNELIAKLRELNTEIDKEYWRLRREKAEQLVGEIIREEGLRL